MFIQLKTDNLLSNATLLSDDAMLNEDNLKYDIDNFQIDNKKGKTLICQKYFGMPLMQLCQIISVPTHILTTSNLSVIFELLHQYSRMF